MRMRDHLRILCCAAILAGAVLAGCSDDDSGDEKAATNPETAPVEKPRPGGRSGKESKEKDGKKGSAGKGKKTTKTVSEAEIRKEREATEKEEAEDRKADREFDRAFRETDFEKVVGKLPIRKPPLFVEQYITSEGDSTVYTAVSRKRFCGRSLARRKAAVAAFYRDADKLFREGDIEDLALIVTPLSGTTERLPALAVARDGKVSLTKRGRRKGSC